MQHETISIPEGLDVINDFNGVTIRRSWYSAAVWAQVLFAIVWDSFLVVWYSIALHHPRHETMDWFAIFFPIGHVAVGVYITYSAVCSFRNSTNIVAQPEQLQIKIGPVWWPGALTLQRSEFTGFAVRERTGGRLGRGFQMNFNTNAYYTYSVVYIDTNNREKVFLSGLSEKDQANYICKYLTGYYALPEKS